ncbi:unnamed protein product, partial [Tenebrio molitor]
DSQGCRGEFVTTTLRHLISTIEAGIDRVSVATLHWSPFAETKRARLPVRARKTNNIIKIERFAPVRVK